MLKCNKYCQGNLYIIGPKQTYRLKIGEGKWKIVFQGVLQN